MSVLSDEAQTSCQNSSAPETIDSSQDNGGAFRTCCEAMRKRTKQGNMPSNLELKPRLQ